MVLIYFELEQISTQKSYVTLIKKKGVQNVWFATFENKDSLVGWKKGIYCVINRDVSPGLKECSSSGVFLPDPTLKNLECGRSFICGPDSSERLHSGTLHSRESVVQRTRLGGWGGNARADMSDPTHCRRPARTMEWRNHTLSLDSEVA